MTASDVAFVEPDRLTRNPPIEPMRAALTAEQVAEHDSPTAPAMASDGGSARWRDETCQRKALPPDVRADIVDQAISEQVGPDLWSERLARARGDRVELLRAPRPSEDRT